MLFETVAVLIIFSLGWFWGYCQGNRQGYALGKKVGYGDRCVEEYLERIESNNANF